MWQVSESGPRGPFVLAIVTAVATMGGGAQVREPMRDPVLQVAAVLHMFTHVCAPAQCMTLRRVASDTSAGADVRTLARALLRVRHRPDPDDRDTLQRLMKEAPDPDVRLLAGVIARLVHVPAPEDKALLQRLLSTRLATHAAQHLDLGRLHERDPRPAPR
jgi:hypothetical protein